MNLIVAENLTREFDLSNPWLFSHLSFRRRHTVRAVDNVNFVIKKGETYGLVGDSGSGKSTIAKMAVGLLKPTSGKITFDGNNLSKSILDKNNKQDIRRKVQMIFQSPYASLNPRWRIGDILAEPIKVFKLCSDTTSEETRVHELLEQVGLSKSDSKRYPHEFSGGQRQRISIARALACEPEVIICDEPTSALDVSVQAQVLNLLKQLQREFSLTYLFITHDLAVVSTMANKIGVLDNGRLIEEQSPKKLFTSPKHYQTKMLLKSAPKIDFEIEKTANLER